MRSKTLLAGALLACCLVAAQGGGGGSYDCAANPPACAMAQRKLRRLLGGDLKWRSGAVTLTRVVGCDDDDEVTPCLTVEEVQDAVHNKAVNVTILSVLPERPDPRLDAWQGQSLTYFFSDGNSTLGDGFKRAAVHAAVTQLDFCPLGGGNVLNITARLDGETTFEGAPVRDDLTTGTVVEVLVGHNEEMEERGHERHLVALLGDSATKPDATC